MMLLNSILWRTLRRTVKQIYGETFSSFKTFSLPMNFVLLGAGKNLDSQMKRGQRLLSLYLIFFSILHFQVCGRGLAALYYRGDLVDDLCKVSLSFQLHNVRFNFFPYLLTTGTESFRMLSRWFFQFYHSYTPVTLESLQTLDSRKK